MSSLRLAMSIDANNPVVGDIFLDSTGKARMTASLREEVQQLLYTRFKFFKGEWFLVPTAGVPWIQKILGIKNSSANVAVILKRVITTCPGVASLTSFSLNPSGRRISPTFVCTLIDGTVLKSSDFAPMIIG